jgi:hypothetical protein
MHSLIYGMDIQADQPRGSPAMLPKLDLYPRYVKHAFASACLGERCATQNASRAPSRITSPLEVRGARSK